MKTHETELMLIRKNAPEGATHFHNKGYSPAYLKRKPRGIFCKWLEWNGVIGIWLDCRLWKEYQIEPLS